MIRHLSRCFVAGLATALGIAAVGNAIDYWQGREPASQLRSTDL